MPRIIDTTELMLSAIEATKLSNEQMIKKITKSLYPRGNVAEGFNQSLQSKSRKNLVSYMSVINHDLKKDPEFYLSNEHSSSKRVICDHIKNGTGMRDAKSIMATLTKLDASLTLDRISTEADRLMISDSRRDNTSFFNFFTRLYQTESIQMTKEEKVLFFLHSNTRFFRIQIWDSFSTQRSALAGVMEKFMNRIGRQIPEEMAQTIAIVQLQERNATSLILPEPALDDSRDASNLWSTRAASVVTRLNGAMAGMHDVAQRLEESGVQINLTANAEGIGHLQNVYNALPMTQNPAFMRLGDSIDLGYQYRQAYQELSDLELQGIVDTSNDREQNRRQTNRSRMDEVAIVLTRGTLDAIDMIIQDINNGARPGMYNPDFMANFTTAVSGATTLLGYGPLTQVPSPIPPINATPQDIMATNLLNSLNNRSGRDSAREVADLITSIVEAQTQAREGRGRPGGGVAPATKQDIEMINAGQETGKAYYNGAILHKGPYKDSFQRKVQYAYMMSGSENPEIKKRGLRIHANNLVMAEKKEDKGDAKGNNIWNKLKIKKEPADTRNNEAIWVQEPSNLESYENFADNYNKFVDTMKTVVSKRHLSDKEIQDVMNKQGVKGITCKDFRNLMHDYKRVNDVAGRGYSKETDEVKRRKKKIEAAEALCKLMSNNCKNGDGNVDIKLSNRLMDSLLDEVKNTKAMPNLNVPHIKLAQPPKSSKDDPDILIQKKFGITKEEVKITKRIAAKKTKENYGVSKGNEFNFQNKKEQIRQLEKYKGIVDGIKKENPIGNKTNQLTVKVNKLNSNKLSKETYSDIGKLMGATSEEIKKAKKQVKLTRKNEDVGYYNIADPKIRADKKAENIIACIKANREEKEKSTEFAAKRRLEKLHEDVERTKHMPLLGASLMREIEIEEIDDSPKIKLKERAEPDNIFTHIAEKQGINENLVIGGGLAIGIGLGAFLIVSSMLGIDTSEMNPEGDEKLRAKFRADYHKKFKDNVKEIGKLPPIKVSPIKNETRGWNILNPTTEVVVPEKLSVKALSVLGKQYKDFRIVNYEEAKEALGGFPPEKLQELEQQIESYKEVIRERINSLREYAKSKVNAQKIQMDQRKKMEDIQDEIADVNGKHDFERQQYKEHIQTINNTNSISFFDRGWTSSAARVAGLSEAPNLYSYGHILTEEELRRYDEGISDCNDMIDQLNARLLEVDKEYDFNSGADGDSLFFIKNGENKCIGAYNSTRTEREEVLKNIKHNEEYNHKGTERFNQDCRITMEYCRIGMFKEAKNKLKECQEIKIPWEKNKEKIEKDIMNYVPNSLWVRMYKYNGMLNRKVKIKHQNNKDNQVTLEPKELPSVVGAYKDVISKTYLTKYCLSEDPQRKLKILNSLKDYCSRNSDNSDSYIETLKILTIIYAELGYLRDAKECEVMAARFDDNFKIDKDFLDIPGKQLPNEMVIQENKNISNTFYDMFRTRSNSYSSDISDSDSVDSNDSDSSDSDDFDSLNKKERHEDEWRKLEKYLENSKQQWRVKEEDLKKVKEFVDSLIQRGEEPETCITLAKALWLEAWYYENLGQYSAAQKALNLAVKNLEISSLDEINQRFNAIKDGEKITSAIEGIKTMVLMKKKMKTKMEIEMDMKNIKNWFDSHKQNVKDNVEYAKLCLLFATYYSKNNQIENAVPYSDLVQQNKQICDTKQAKDLNEIIQQQEVVREWSIVENSIQELYKTSKSDVKDAKYGEKILHLKSLFNGKDNEKKKVIYAELLFLIALYYDYNKDHTKALNYIDFAEQNKEFAKRKKFKKYQKIIVDNFHNDDYLKSIDEYINKKYTPGKVEIRLNVVNEYVERLLKERHTSRNSLLLAKCYGAKAKYYTLLGAYSYARSVLNIANKNQEYSENPPYPNLGNTIQEGEELGFKIESLYTTANSDVKDKKYGDNILQMERWFNAQEDDVRDNITYAKLLFLIAYYYFSNNNYKEAKRYIELVLQNEYMINRSDVSRYNKKIQDAIQESHTQNLVVNNKAVSELYKLLKTDKIGKGQEIKDLLKQANALLKTFMEEGHTPQKSEPLSRLHNLLAVLYLKDTQYINSHRNIVLYLKYEGSREYLITDDTIEKLQTSICYGKDSETINEYINDLTSEKHKDIPITGHLQRVTEFIKNLTNKGYTSKEYGPLAQGYWLKALCHVKLGNYEAAREALNISGENEVMLSISKYKDLDEHIKQGYKAVELINNDRNSKPDEEYFKTILDMENKFKQIGEIDAVNNIVYARLLILISNYYFNTKDYKNAERYSNLGGVNEYFANSKNFKDYKEQIAENIKKSKTPPAVVQLKHVENIKNVKSDSKPKEDGNATAPEKVKESNASPAKIKVEQQKSFVERAAPQSSHVNKLHDNIKKEDNQKQHRG